MLRNKQHPYYKALPVVMLLFSTFFAKESDKVKQDVYLEKTPQAIVDIIKGFNLSKLEDNKIRIYLLPAFSKSSYFEIDEFKTKICSHGTDSNVGMNCEEYLNSKYGVMFDSLAEMRLDTMKTVISGNHITIDGSMLVVETNLNSKWNLFCFPVGDFYLDERYNRLSKLFGGGLEHRC